MKYAIRFSLLVVFLGTFWACQQEALTPTDSLSGDDARETFAKAGAVAEYEIVLENLAPAGSQPFSPPVLVTHRPPLRLFKLNSFASDELRQIAEDAVNVPMVNFLNQSDEVFAWVEGDGAIPPGAAASFTIEARRSYHKLSLVSMLVNTNDAFTGADKINLPARGSAEYYLRAYDAGTEENTELTAHIPGPCCGNPLMRVPTHERIQFHQGILGGGDLDPAVYDWDEPVAKLTITRIN